MAEPLCSFEFEDLDLRDGALFLSAGQDLRGTVVVKALEELTFRSVRVQLRWRTSGKGNKTTGVGSTVELTREGRWPAGSSQRFSFSIPVPWGPISYSGSLLNVGWEVELEVDRSFPRGDVREGVPVVLSAAPVMRDFDLGPVPQKEGQLEALKGGLTGVWLALGMILLLGGVVYGAAMGWEIDGARRIAFLVFLVLGFLLTMRGFWGRLGRGKLGEPTVKLSSTDLRRGGEVHFDVTIRPRQRTDLRSLHAILECEERVVLGHGQYRSRHRKTVYEEKVALAEPRVVEPHRGLRKHGTLTIPEDAAPSFGAEDNQVVWWLRFEADLAGWPDWKEPRLLTIRP